MNRPFSTVGICIAAVLVISFPPQKLRAEKAFLSPDFRTNPYDFQVTQQIDKLQSESPTVRAGAAEALGYLHEYAATDKLLALLRNNNKFVFTNLFNPPELKFVVFVK